MGLNSYLDFITPLRLVRRSSFSQSILSDTHFIYQIEGAKNIRTNENTSDAIEVCVCFSCLSLAIWTCLRTHWRALWAKTCRGPTKIHKFVHQTHLEHSAGDLLASTDIPHLAPAPHLAPSLDSLTLYLPLLILI